LKRVVSGPGVARGVRCDAEMAVHRGSALRADGGGAEEISGCTGAGAFGEICRCRSWGRDQGAYRAPVNATFLLHCAIALSSAALASVDAVEGAVRRCRRRLCRVRGSRIRWGSAHMSSAPVKAGVPAALTMVVDVANAVGAVGVAAPKKGPP
jgi:hypothetical protein